MRANPTEDAAGGGAGRLADLPARIAFAIPAAVVAIALIALGGPVFAVGMAAIGVAALLEAYRLLGVPPRLAGAGCAGLVALVLFALLEGRAALPGVFAGAVVVILAAAVAPPAPVPVSGKRSQAIALAVFGLIWVGLGVTHAVLIRELPHGGGLLIDVLLAVFIGDTAAHILGSLYGRRKLAPTISPSKTIEGLVAGVIAGVAAPVIVALAFQPWLEPLEAACIGLAAALAAPVGDLFESLVKRDAQVKDSGALLGPHGGVLDRIDAVLFAVVASYYVAVALPL